MNFLKVNLCVLLCILIGALCGCGSDSGSGAPAVKKEAKAPAGQASRVVELLTGKGKGDKVRETSALPMSPASMGGQDIPVLPPNKPGGKPITQAELAAGLAKLPPVDPNTLEIIPPSKPGGKGYTKAELDSAMRNEQRPQRIEVIPPEVPGGKGFTQKELDDSITKAVGQKDSQELEVIPSPIPGAPGVTQRELNASMPMESSNPDNSPFPPEQSSTTGKTPASPPSQSGVPR